MATQLCRLWPVDGLAPSAWPPVSVGFSTDYLTQTKVDSLQECVCFPRMFVYAQTLVCFCVCLLAGLHVCDDGTSSRVIMHLLRKCCQIMLTPQPGGGSARREEMSGREWNVCVHYAYEPLPHFCFRRLHTPKSLNSGDAADAYMSWVNLYHVCHRKIKALVYSGALLSLPISISKRRRWHGRVLSHPSRPEQTGPDWTKGIIAGMWLHSTGLREAMKMGHL